MNELEIIKTKRYGIKNSFQKKENEISEYKLNKLIKKEIKKLKDEINIYKQLLFELFE